MKVEISKIIDVSEKFRKVFNFDRRTPGLASEDDIREWLELCMEMHVVEIVDIYDQDMKRERGKKKLLDSSIDNLEMSVRLWNCLRVYNVGSILELTQFRPRDLLRMKNLGRKSLNEAVRLLSSHGLFLRDDAKDMSDVACDKYNLRRMSSYVKPDEDLKVRTRVLLKDCAPPSARMSPDSKNFNEMLKSVFDVSADRIYRISVPEVQLRLWHQISLIVTPREYEVLHMWWVRKHDYRETAARFSVTPQRIKQVMTRAMLRLRRQKGLFGWAWMREE